MENSVLNPDVRAAAMQALEEDQEVRRVSFVNELEQLVERHQVDLVAQPLIDPEGRIRARILIQVR